MAPDQTTGTGPAALCSKDAHIPPRRGGAAWASMAVTCPDGELATRGPVAKGKSSLAHWDFGHTLTSEEVPGRQENLNVHPSRQT